MNEMSKDAVARLTERLSRVERSNARLKRLMLLATAAAGLAVGLGASPQSSPQTEVRAQYFRLVDGNDRLVATLGLGTSNRPGLWFHDGDQQRVVLWQGDDGLASFRAKDFWVVNRSEKNLACLGTSSKGHASIWFFDESGQPMPMGTVPLKPGGRGG